MPGLRKALGHAVNEALFELKMAASLGVPLAFSITYFGGKTDRIGCARSFPGYPRFERSSAEKEKHSRTFLASNLVLIAVGPRYELKQ